MSRIEKAIEVAARKRIQDEEYRPSTQPLVFPEKDNDKASEKQGRQITTRIENPYLVTANDQGAPASEQYRKLKSLIVKLSQAGDFEKSLMVTSPVAGEGKTITSLNLAITMAQEFDHTVLLVEADIRKPSVLNYLGLKAERGLTDCVLDGLDLKDVLVKTGIGSLSVLPAGRRVDNPVELFSSNRMQTLFAEIKSRYNDRYVIVDTTPLLPFAEPSYIASMTGAVVVVVREGVTTMDKLKSSLEMLKNHNLLGVISNCVSRVNTLQGYYGYYGYYNDR
ncbi:MAG: XrtA-associated tyrosine autokinase [Desulfuromonadales bacterium]|nr:XrtA-associated tyrosine autokinase [Desulfuromonadales bacterium]